MKTKQLSIFLENKSGRLTEVTEVLGAAGINLSAMSIADNSDFGILRCIVSDPDKAYQVLKEAHFAVKITDVIGFVCPNTSGSLAIVLKHLSQNGIFIEYMYSFCGHSGNPPHRFGCLREDTFRQKSGVDGRKRPLSAINLQETARFSPENFAVSFFLCTFAPANKKQGRLAQLV